MSRIAQNAIATAAAPKTSGDVAKLNQTVDVTKEREVPVMTADAFDACWDRFVLYMHLDPLPSEKPSAHHLAAMSTSLSSALATYAWPRLGHGVVWW